MTGIYSESTIILIKSYICCLCNFWFKQTAFGAFALGPNRLAWLVYFDPVGKGNQHGTFDRTQFGYCPEALAFYQEAGKMNAANSLTAGEAEVVQIIAPKPTNAASAWPATPNWQPWKN